MDHFMVSIHVDLTFKHLLPSTVELFSFYFSTQVFHRAPAEPELCDKHIMCENVPLFLHLMNDKLINKKVCYL